MSYVPVGGAGGGAWTAIETVTISNQATVEMDLSGSHKMYQLHIDNLVPATDDVFLFLRFSIDGGSTFLSGASDYSWGLAGNGAGAGSLVDGDTADTEITLSRDFDPGTLGNGSTESYNGWINIHNANQTVNAVCVSSNVGMLDKDAELAGFTNQGGLIANINEVDAIQLLASSGNLTSGRVTLYGLGLS